MLPMDGWKGVGWPVPIVNWFVRDARVWDDIDVYFRDLPSSSSNQQFESLLLGNALATKRSVCSYASVVVAVIRRALFQIGILSITIAKFDIYLSF